MKSSEYLNINTENLIDSTVGPMEGKQQKSPNQMCRWLRMEKKLIFCIISTINLGIIIQYNIIICES